MLLMLAQKFRVKFDIARFVNTMDVSESGSDTEVGANGTQSCVDIPNILWLSVKLGVVDAGVIDTVFLSTSDTDLHLEPDAKGRHALEVLDAGGDIILFALFGKVKHVGGEERFLVLLEVGFISLEHTIEPRQEFVSAMVRVQDDGTWWGESDVGINRMGVDETHTP
jgi:hypothetical protein